MKNATPISIARITSVAIAFCIFLVLMIAKVFFPDSIDWIVVVLTPVFTVVLVYIIFYYVLENFLYRKIKLIYKSIYDVKVSKKDKNKSVKMSKDVISDAEYMVIEWKKKKTQETLKQKKLETYRKEFLGNVFHELKTPIFNIQGYLETLVEGGIHDPKINLKFMQKARKNVKRMTEIVDDLQMISNLEDGSFSLVKSKFDIFHLTSEAIETHDIRAAKKGISITFKEECDRPFQVIADRELIYQVLNNLITNSIKYGKEGGSIKIGLYDMNEKILVEVADDGIGIDQVHLQRIFERFYRADKDRSRDLGGSGLGLSIVKHIIEAHKQPINIRSTIGVGTTIGFALKKG